MALESEAARPLTGVAKSFKEAAKALRRSAQDEEGSYLFYAAVAIFTLQYSMTLTLVTWGIVPGLLKVATVALLVLRASMQDYSKRSILVISLGGAVALLCALFSGDLTLLYVWMFAATAKNARVQTVAMIVFVVLGAMLLLFSAFALLGIVPSTTQIRTDGLVRSSLGFYHVNIYGGVAMAALVSYLVLRFPSFTWFDLVVGAVFLGLLELGSKSRTAEAIMGASIVLAFICSSSRRLGARGQKACAVAVACVGVAPILFVVYFMFFYSSAVPWEAKLNAILSDRLNLMSTFAREMPLTLFGQDVSGAPAVGEYAGYVVDSGYANLFIKNGVIPFILWVGATLAIYRDSIRRGRVGAVVLGVTALSLFGIAESRFDTIVFNFYITYAISVLIGPMPTKKRSVSGSISWWMRE